MQLHRQLPELREGGAGRGEDLSNLGAEQHLRGAGGAPSQPSLGSARPPPSAHQPGARQGAHPPVAARERSPRGRSNLGGR